MNGLVVASWAAIGVGVWKVFSSRYIWAKADKLRSSGEREVAAALDRAGKIQAERAKAWTTVGLVIAAVNLVIIFVG